MLTTIPASHDATIVAMEYDATGLEWCRLFDHRVKGWRVNDTMPTVPTLQPAMQNLQWAFLENHGATVVGV